MLCFGFIMRLMLVTQWLFRFCSVAVALIQRLYSRSCSAVERMHEKQGGLMTPHGWDTWPGLAKGTFHTGKHHTQHKNKAFGWEGLIAAQELDGHQLGVVRNCFGHHLFLWGFSRLFLTFSLWWPLVVGDYILFQLLSC